MNSLQIIKVLESDKYTKKKFLGVFARDELPIKIKYPSCLILNTDKRNGPGEHWLAIFYDENKNAEFFDSFGYMPDFYKLTTYLNKTCKNWQANQQRIQGFFSKLCGLYCLFFLHQKCRNVTLQEIQNNFNKEKQDLNDDIVLKFIKNY